jgi:putative AdoMet-dependent methyltransferase
MKPAWEFDEFKHIGVDFANEQQVATYDARQQTDFQEEIELVQRLGIAPGNIVVEFGPGTGAFSRAAASVGAHVISVDISKAMLNYGRLKAAESGLNTMDFVNSGFLSYEHHGAPADFVVTKFALHHLPDFWKASALLRIYQLLGDGGTLYLKDVVFSFPVEEAEQHLNAWMDAIASESGDGFSRADFEMHIRDEYSTFSWILEGLLEQAGFTQVQARYTSPTYAEYLCVKS